MADAIEQHDLRPRDTFVEGLCRAWVDEAVLPAEKDQGRRGDGADAVRHFGLAIERRAQRGRLAVAGKAQQLPIAVDHRIVDDALPRDRTAKRLLDQRARGNLARERSEEHTSELQSLMRISSAVFC